MRCGSQMQDSDRIAGFFIAIALALSFAVLQFQQRAVEYRFSLSSSHSQRTCVTHQYTNITQLSYYSTCTFIHHITSHTRTRRADHEKTEKKLLRKRTSVTTIVLLSTGVGAIRVLRIRFVCPET